MSEITNASDGADEATATIATIAILAARIADLEARLAQVEAGGTPPAVPAAPTAATDPARADGPVREARIERRALLGSAGRVAAGALAGGTALAIAQAGPAAAASGTFDGNPAVSATNTAGSSGRAITATGGAGNGIEVTNASAAAGAAALKASCTVAGSGAAIDATAPGSAAVRATNNGSTATIIAGNNATTFAAGNALFATSGGDTVYAQSAALRSNAAGVHTEGYNEAHGLDATAIDAGTGVRSTGHRADLQLGHRTDLATAPAARSHTNGHAVGELVLDASTGNVFACVVAAPAGQVGTWRKVTGPGTAGALHVLATTTRVFDSREGFPPANPGKGLFTNEQRVIDATFNGSGVPAGATAVLVNLAVTATNSGGFGALFRNGTTWPGNASVNWSQPATTISNLAVVGVDGAATFLCRIAGSAHVIVDVIGYFL